MARNVFLQARHNEARACVLIIFLIVKSHKGEIFRKKSSPLSRGNKLNAHSPGVFGVSVEILSHIRVLNFIFI